MPADFVLLDQDLSAISAEAVNDVRVRLTVVGRRVVLDRAASGVVPGSAPE